MLIVLYICYKHISPRHLSWITENLSYVIEKIADLSLWCICIVVSPTWDDCLQLMLLMLLIVHVELFSKKIILNVVSCLQDLRATSHTRLRAREHNTSSTLIGGRSGTDPSLLHNMYEGPCEPKMVPTCVLNSLKPLEVMF